MVTSIHSLPPEIRHMIWKQAASRVIEVRWESLVGYTLSSYPPAMLTLCRESYCITHQLFWPAENHCISNDISFNWDVDTLYYPYPSPCSTSYGMSLGRFLNRHPTFKGLKHLALCLPPRIPPDGTCMEFLGAVQKQARCIMEYGLALNSLTLVFGDPYMTDFNSVPKATTSSNASNNSTQVLAPAPTKIPPASNSLPNTAYTEPHPKPTSKRPKAAQYLHAINETRTSPCWKRAAASEALRFYLSSDLPDVWIPTGSGHWRKCGTFGSPEILWKGVSRRERREEDDQRLELLG